MYHFNLVDDNNEPLHFDSVRHCILHTNSFSTIKNLSFSHLESLETTYTDKEHGKFNDFFRRNKNLSQLYLRSICGTKLNIVELTAELPNLTEMIVKFYSGVYVEHVIRFIVGHRKLMKFQCPVHEIAKEQRERLRVRFERDWHIRSIFDINVAFVFEKRIKL